MLSLTHTYLLLFGTVCHALSDGLHWEPVTKASASHTGSKIVIVPVVSSVEDTENHNEGLKSSFICLERDWIRPLISSFKVTHLAHSYDVAIRISENLRLDVSSALAKFVCLIDLAVWHLCLFDENFSCYCWKFFSLIKKREDAQNPQSFAPYLLLSSQFSRQIQEKARCLAPKKGVR